MRWCYDLLVTYISILAKIARLFLTANWLSVQLYWIHTSTCCMYSYNSGKPPYVSCAHGRPKACQHQSNAWWKSLLQYTYIMSLYIQNYWQDKTVMNLEISWQIAKNFLQYPFVIIMPFAKPFSSSLISWIHQCFILPMFFVIQWVEK